MSHNFDSYLCSLIMLSAFLVESDLFMGDESKYQLLQLWQKNPFSFAPQVLEPGLVIGLVKVKHFQQGGCKTEEVARWWSHQSSRPVTKSCLVHNAEGWRSAPKIAKHNFACTTIIAWIRCTWCFAKCPDSKYAAVILPLSVANLSRYEQGCKEVA